MGATLNNGSNFFFLAPFPRKALKEGRFFDGVQSINGCMEAYAKAHMETVGLVSCDASVWDFSQDLGMVWSTLNVRLFYIIFMIVEWSSY